MLGGRSSWNFRRMRVVKLGKKNHIVFKQYRVNWERDSRIPPFWNNDFCLKKIFPICPRCVQIFTIHVNFGQDLEHLYWKKISKIFVFYTIWFKFITEIAGIDKKLGPTNFDQDRIRRKGALAHVLTKIDFLFQK